MDSPAGRPLYFPHPLESKRPNDAKLGEPVWSPDGKSIAFSVTSGGDDHELWLMEDCIHVVKAAKK